MAGPMRGLGPRGFLTEEEKANKPKVTKELLLRILSYLKPYKLQFALVFVAILLSAAVGLMPSVITGRIVDEALVREDKIYQIIVAEYSGRTEEYTLAELYFGRINIDRGGVELNDLLCSWERILSVRIAGKEGAGERADEERELQRQISEIKNKGETK